MFQELSEKDREQIVVLVGALSLKAKKILKGTYPHLQGTRFKAWHRMLIQWFLFKHCFDE